MNTLKIGIIMLTMSLLSTALATNNLKPESQDTTDSSCDELLNSIAFTEKTVKKIERKKATPIPLQIFAHRIKVQRERMLGIYEQKCLPYMTLVEQASFKMKHKHLL